MPDVSGGLPRVKAVQEGATARITCPYCGQTHWHGLFAGRVEAHCEDPALTKRYYILELPDD